MDKPEIEFSYEHVKFVRCEYSGNKIFRPKTMGAKQWLDFWDAVAHYEDPERELAEMQKALDDAKSRIDELLEQVEYLRNELNGVENVE